MTNEVTLGWTLKHMDAWLLTSLLRWGPWVCLLTIAMAVVFMLAIFKTERRQVAFLIIFGWSLAAVGLFLKVLLHRRYLSLCQTPLSAAQWHEAVWRLKAVADTLILPGIFSIVAMLRHHSLVRRLLGSWSFTLLLATTILFVISTYFTVRMADWLICWTGLSWDSVSLYW